MVAKYALEGLANKVLAAQYKMTLPQEQKIVAELKRTRKILESRNRKRRLEVRQWLRWNFRAKI